MTKITHAFSKHKMAPGNNSTTHHHDEQGARFILRNELMLAADLHRTLGELHYQNGGGFVNPIMHKYKAMELRQQLGEHLFTYVRNDLFLVYCYGDMRQN